MIRSDLTIILYCSDIRTVHTAIVDTQSSVQSAVDGVIQLEIHGEMDRCSLEKLALRLPNMFADTLRKSLLPPMTIDCTVDTQNSQE